MGYIIIFMLQFYVDFEYFKKKTKKPKTKNKKLGPPKMSKKMFTYENISSYERTYFYIN